TLHDLVFLAPFVVGPGEPRRLSVSIDRKDGTLAITSEGAAGSETHVVGRVGAPDTTTPPLLSISAIRARCRQEQVVASGGFLDQDFMNFGPRWGNIRRIASGDAEALLDLELGAPFAADLSQVGLHPALLDMATGAAQHLIPGFDHHRDFYVPFSYGRVVVHHPLVASVHSHVRYKAPSNRSAGSSPAGDTAAFDVIIAGDDGRPLVSITDFVMKRLTRSQGAFAATAAVASSSSSSGHAAAGAAALREVALREGMTPPEGLDALARLLTRRPAAQVVVSSVDVVRWQAAVNAQAAAAAQAATGTATTESNAASADAGASDRPALASAYVEPSDHWQRLVAGVWQGILGIQRIGIHDNFFELGGHSLLLTQAATRVRKAAALDLPLATLFSKLTIAELAADLQKASETAATSTAVKAAPLRAVSREAYRVKRQKPEVS
ncbi:MAG: hypothetical protein QOI66_3285, partial [Myxococcales bacterium]|nr:hypothetical protein [Myxococcales bacterium]